MSPHRPLIVGALAAALIFGAVACGGDDGDASAGSDTVSGELASTEDAAAALRAGAGDVFAQAGEVTFTCAEDNAGTPALQQFSCDVQFPEGGDPIGQYTAVRENGAWTFEPLGNSAALPEGTGTTATDAQPSAGDAANDAAIAAAERDEALRAAVVAHLLRSGRPDPGSADGSTVLVGDGECLTGAIWLQSEADAFGATLQEIAGAPDAGIVDESGTLIVEVRPHVGEATQSDCLRALDEALVGFDATQVE